MALKKVIVGKKPPPWPMARVEEVRLKREAREDKMTQDAIALAKKEKASRSKK